MNNTYSLASAKGAPFFRSAKTISWILRNTPGGVFSGLVAKTNTQARAKISSRVVQGDFRETSREGLFVVQQIVEGTFSELNLQHLQT